MRGVRICTRPWSIGSHPSRALKQRNTTKSRKNAATENKSDRFDGARVSGAADEAAITCPARRQKPGRTLP